MPWYYRGPTITHVTEIIQRYYHMQDGEHIEDFHHEIEIENGELRLVLKHRVMKHIVEQRKRDGYHVYEILELFTDIYMLMKNKKYSLINNYKEEHFLFVEIIQDRTKGVVLVLEIIKESNNRFYIKTGFYRAANKVKKLLRKQNTH